LLETFKNSSIITWQHINFHGEYDFSEEKTRDSIGFNLPKILSLQIGRKWEVKVVAKFSK
jgi:hypothetical protein